MRWLRLHLHWHSQPVPGSYQQSFFGMSKWWSGQKRCRCGHAQTYEYEEINEIR